MRRIGLISDTHGLVRPEALAALQGCQQVLHGGDIGGPEVLAALAAVAPVLAVRGNNDFGALARDLPETLDLAIDGVRIHIVHDLPAGRAAAEGSGARVVVSGHSHRPQVHERAGVLYVNPGSAGPRRFRLPVTLAVLELGGGAPRAMLVPLLQDRVP